MLWIERICQGWGWFPSYSIVGFEVADAADMGLAVVATGGGDVLDGMIILRGDVPCYSHSASMQIFTIFSGVCLYQDHMSVPYPEPWGWESYDMQSTAD